MFTEQYGESLKRLSKNSQDQAALSELSSGYWSYLADTAGALLREKKELDKFIDNEKDLINFGLCPGVIDVEKTRAAILNGDLSESRIPVITMSDWLKDFVTKINQGDKKEQITRDLHLAEIQIKKLRGELKSAQALRSERLHSHLEKGGPSVKRRIDELDNIDQMIYESIRWKKSVSKGVFFTVDQKRENCNREILLKKELENRTSLIESVGEREIISELKKVSSGIEEILIRIIDSENSVAKMSEDIDVLEKKAGEMSPLEAQNKVMREIEYMRDLTKLSAKRLHMESVPLLRDSDKFITCKTLLDYINRILEFDPHIFHNDRVTIFGKPQIFLIPGTGNALYDWKNNRIMVPLTAPGGNLLASVACGVIEYRLDVDEDKYLLTSYNQIPELKGIRSVFQLRNRLIKDYIGWMTSEYKGYRILSREIKDWFEHEIAPPKNDIYTPPELQQYAVSTVEYKRMLENTASKIKSIESCTGEDLWVSSILLYQQGKFDKSFELVSSLVKKEPDNLLALFNLGQVAMKLMNKKQAIEAFSEYCTKNPQSWWARIARDNIRRLQVG